MEALAHTNPCLMCRSMPAQAIVLELIPYIRVIVVATALVFRPRVGTILGAQPAPEPPPRSPKGTGPRAHAHFCQAATSSSHAPLVTPVARGSHSDDSCAARPNHRKQRGL